MYTHPTHLTAFAVTTTLMLGGFAVVPFIASYLVDNAGVSEKELPIVYVIGGACTLFSSPIVGRLADRYGKLKAFRVAVPCSALIMFGTTILPEVGVIGGSIATAALMVANTSRMVAAMSMITGSVEPSRRGGFMSANSSVQHLTAGLGTFLAGLVVTQSADGRLQGFAWAGVFAAVTTLMSLPFAARLRPALGRASHAGQPSASLAAAAEATCDAGEPLATLGAETIGEERLPAEGRSESAFTNGRAMPVGCGVSPGTGRSEG
jgi:predicted MFS family arabinose efflux permease